MNYHIEKLNEQTWLIEEYSNTASAYMYLLTGKEKALLIDTGFGTIPLKSICEELTGLPVTVALTHGPVSYTHLLFDWAKELIEKDIHTVNMLGCHDGIPLLDLKGLLSEERIQNLIDTVVGRGGYVKDLHGQKNMYYQVNATYYSALGEDDAKMLLARALQLFMPGKPQIWYCLLYTSCTSIWLGGIFSEKTVEVKPGEITELLPAIEM